MTDELTILQPIFDSYLRSRKTKFAKSNNIDPNNVIVINDKPIDEMFSKWKKENHIRTRIFKNLSSEQQNNWVEYFNINKSLSLTTKPHKSSEETKPHKSKHKSSNKN